MPKLEAGGLVRDIDIVVFDKDGTLIDFDRAWSGRLTRGIAAIGASASADLAGRAREREACNLEARKLEAGLYATLGGDPVSGRIVRDGPYVSASIVDTCTIAATVLYQAGLPWSRCEAIVAEAFRPILASPVLPGELRGIGDVAGLFGRLKAAGFRLAVATNDERISTRSGLEALGVAPLLDAVVCADDAGLAPKPAPDGLLHIARTLQVVPGRLAIIGDAVSDLRAGRAAGAGLVVGVVSGPSTARQLRLFADVVVDDIHALRSR